MDKLPNGAGARPEIEDVPINLSDEDELLKCECGSDEFIGVEDYFWSVQFHKDTKEAMFTDAVSEIKGIRCAECDKEMRIPEGYEYNFN